MTLHRNARTCPNSRRLIADRVLGGGWTLAAAAEAAGVSVPTARKWVRRFRELGDAGLQDRSSAPKRIPHRTPPERERAILSLRALRLTGEQIAAALGMAPSTVSLVLKRNGQGGCRGRGRASLSVATSARERASWSTSTSRSSAGSRGRAPHDRLAGERGHHRARFERVGNTSMSASTTPPGSPTSRCSKTSAPRPASASSSARSPTSPATASRSSG